MYGRPQDIYDGTVDPENINTISEGDIEYDATQMKTLQNTRLIIKMSEVNLFNIGDSVEIEKFQKYFLIKRI